MRRVLHKDSNCIDIGCHQRVFLDEILKLAPNGFHYAFEPPPDLNHYLISKFKDSRNVEIHDIALSDSTGKVTFEHVVSNPSYSGLRRRKYDRPN